ncbi:MAG: hypothetical protein JO069_05025 [Verrucomicrobia bacterium]|nr:hypothetical protein [Verrucomicrobiota bacterium]
MRTLVVWLVWIGSCLFLPRADSLAQGSTGELVESYVARLSARDHFNSNGERLQSPAAIIRQDRANFYVFGYRDPEDEPDRFFSSKENRAYLERLLERGRTTPGARRIIVNGTPLVRVDVYENFVTVTVISD